MRSLSYMPEENTPGVEGGHEMVGGRGGSGSLSADFGRVSFGERRGRMRARRGAGFRGWARRLRIRITMTMMMMRRRRGWL